MTAFWEAVSQAMTFGRGIVEARRQARDRALDLIGTMLDDLQKGVQAVLDNKNGPDLMGPWGAILQHAQTLSDPSGFDWLNKPRVAHLLAGMAAQLHSACSADDIVGVQN